MPISKLRAALCLCLCLSALSMAAPAAAEDAAAPADSSVAAASGDKVERSVVKVFTTTRYPDPFRPWTKQAPTEISGSGVVIEGKRILTNAHVVLYSSQVQIQANQGGDKISATVESIAPGIDLAVLKLDDPAFFDSHPPLPRANTLPAVKDAVLAYGFPTGGSSLSITKGIVSRIEFVSYNAPTAGLRIQIDAAINPGNSGGPAVAGDKMIGLAFSKLGDAQNIGYIIPNEEIELFLQDIADGHYDGKPMFNDYLQTLENPALRSYLKLDKSVSGMVVHQTYSSDPSYPLKEWDLITQIGDTPIDDQGKIALTPDLRVNFQYLVQKVAKNGKLPLGIVRAGKPLQLQVPVSADKPMLISDLHGSYPPYFIYGPLVFSKASYQFLGFLSSRELMSMFSYVRSPLLNQIGDKPDATREELVVVSSPFFPHKLSKGYSSAAGSVVRSVNGTPVRSLRHLVALLRDLKDEFVTFEFDNRGGEALVFPRAEMVAATDEILTDNGVRAQGTPELLQVWQGKAP
ncbi:MAG: trypsin-like peptidase domain-containing protein [Nevskia sp.]|nr:trypsin-like peptidase domain-containing protein [Nevskia sp.]